VKTWEWNKVHSELTKIGVKLTWETKSAGSSGHNHGNEVVKITIGWGGELEGTEADIVKGFVIDAENFIGGLDELVDREGAVVGLDDGIRNLW
jgi:hypothetical protein